LKEAKVIRSYVPLFGSSRASASLHILSRKKSVKRNSGLYKYGHGKKSIIWYWEFDVEKRYFHQFRTIDYAAAIEFYKANKFTMWEEEEEESDTEDNQEDHEEEGEGDSHEHAAKHEREEQRQAEADVQGQNSGQNVQDGSDSKDNDNRQDNEEKQRGNRDMDHSS